MPQTDTEIKVREIRDAVAARVRSARAGKRLNQMEVAKQAGVAQSRVSEIENGTSDPKLSTLARVANVLGLTVSVIDDAA
jgi:transcriptional regulator with XRE-family HTH domain